MRVVKWLARNWRIISLIANIVAIVVAIVVGLYRPPQGPRKPGPPDDGF